MKQICLNLNNYRNCFKNVIYNYDKYENKLLFLKKNILN